MAWTILYPSVFATAPIMLLHNPPTHVARVLIPTSQRAVISLITLPDQTLYDLDGTDPAPVLPGSFVAEVELRMAVSAWQAEISAWGGQLGVRSVLSALKPAGGTSSCTARLESLEDVTEQPTFLTTRRVIRLTFQAVTLWT